MPWVEFEEKELEVPLDAHLAARGLMWPPGQVLENVVGFDIGLKVELACFWALFGHAKPLDGAVISTGWWPNAPAGAFVNRQPPKYKLNAFLQYKRPEYLRGATAKERQRWPNGIYYRFFVQPDQQLALEACASALAANGLVLYATPAFHSRDALFLYIETGALISNTHFVAAAKLKGHGRYTYKDASAAGQAHSRPVDVTPHVFDEPRFQRMSVAPQVLLDVSRNHYQDERSREDQNSSSGGGAAGDPPRRAPPHGDGNGRAPAEILRDARIAAEAAVAVSPARVGGLQRFQQRIETATTTLVGLAEEDQPPVRDFIIATIFAALSNLAWFIQ